VATLPSDLQDQLPDGMEVRIASLTDEGQQQVIDALQDAQTDGGLDEDAYDHAVTNAENADYDRENVEELHTEQAKAADAGDYDKAQDYANKAEYELKDIDDLGGHEAAHEVVEAQTDQQELGTAQSDQDYAHQNAEYAASDHGTEAGREAAAETADHYAEEAAHYGAQADMGGTYGDHSYSATSSDAATAEDTAGTEE
jgi:hypothetical protein